VEIYGQAGHYRQCCCKLAGRYSTVICICGQIKLVPCVIPLSSSLYVIINEKNISATVLCIEHQTVLCIFIYIYLYDIYYIYNTIFYLLYLYYIIFKYTAKGCGSRSMSRWPPLQYKVQFYEPLAKVDTLSEQRILYKSQLDKERPGTALRASKCRHLTATQFCASVSV
jgi:hypothetical protein